MCIGILHIGVCVCVCINTHSPLRGCYILWNWGYRQVWLLCGCWDLNLGPLEEQTVLLTTEPSFLSPLELD